MKISSKRDNTEYIIAFGVQALIGTAVIVVWLSGSRRRVEFVE